MTHAPETSASLLIRLQDSTDQEAWNEFARLYSPMIHRIALQKGTQHHDADDVVQHVLIAVAKAVGEWQTDPQRCRFRTWLHRVARNATINALTRGSRNRGTGDTQTIALLNDYPMPPDPDTDFIHREFCREAFRWAAQEIRCEFHSTTWRAFWLTTVEGHAISEVARRLDLTQGAIYAARSRIMRRLKVKVRELTDEDAVQRLNSSQ